MKNRTICHASSALLVLLVVTLIGCSKSPESAKPAGEKVYQLGFCMTLDDPYWQNMRIGAIDEGKRLGAEVTITNAKEDPNLQIQQIQEMIAKQVDAVCVVPMKTDALVSGIQALNRAKIPVILVNREVAEGCDYVCYTGTDTYDGAVTSAKILMEAIGGKGGIVELHQHLGTAPEIARSKALRDIMKNYPEVTLLARVPHEGDRGKAVKEMQTLLEKFPDLKGVYVHGDPQAIAAAEACQAAGRQGIAIVGMGGSQEAIEAIKEGKITGTSFQRPEEEGRNGVRLAIRHLKGEKLDRSNLIPCPPITKANASQFKGQF